MLKRILSALVGIPIVAGAIIYGGWVFTVFTAILTVIAYMELSNMFAKKSLRISPVVAIGNVLCVVLAYLGGSTGLLAGIMITFMLLSFHMLFNYRNEKCIENANVSFWAVLYSGVLLAHFVLLRRFMGSGNLDTAFGSLSYGDVLLWLVVLGTWASDTFAYFVGIAIGKRRMWPAISPKKSWEGAIAGFIGCTLTVVLVGNLLFGMTYGVLAGIGLLVGFFAPLGDLLESMLKRHFDIKDSGNLIPGHGGVLDRFDSLIIAVPVVFYFLQLVIN